MLRLQEYYLAFRELSDEEFSTVAVAQHETRGWDVKK